MAVTWGTRDTHRPHDLDPTDLGRLLARDAGELSMTSTSATGLETRRGLARWTRKKEIYLRVAGELKWRRCFGRVSGGASRRRRAARPAQATREKKGMGVRIRR